MERIRDYSKKSLMPKLYLGNVITITSAKGAGGVNVAEALRVLLPKYEIVIVENGDEALLSSKIPVLGFQGNVVVQGPYPQILIPWSFHGLLLSSSRKRAERCLGEEREKDPAMDLETVHEKIKEQDEIDERERTRLYPGYKWTSIEYDFWKSTDREFSFFDLAKMMFEKHEKWCEEKAKLGQLKI